MTKIVSVDVPWWKNSPLLWLLAFERRAAAFGIFGHLFHPILLTRTGMKTLMFYGCFIRLSGEQDTPSYLHKMVLAERMCLFISKVVLHQSIDRSHRPYRNPSNHSNTITIRWGILELGLTTGSSLWTLTSTVISFPTLMSPTPVLHSRADISVISKHPNGDGLRYHRLILVRSYTISGFTEWSGIIYLSRHRLFVCPSDNRWKTLPRYFNAQG